jgi:hypothetical protein
MTSHIVTWNLLYILIVWNQDLFPLSMMRRIRAFDSECVSHERCVHFSIFLSTVTVVLALVSPFFLALHW